LPPLPAAETRGAPPRLVPGQPYAGVARLRERLVALGDFPTEPRSEPRSELLNEPRNALRKELPTAPLYDGALMEAVRAFQSRHGLTPDGVVGRATLAALEIAPAARAQQIALTLERLRWTPLMQAPRMVVINLPEFVLRAYEVDERGQIHVRTTMKVIVGKALDTRTPVFVETLRAIEFSPYWNVPPSIARGETVPRLRRDPGYFVREGFEFVDGSGRSVTELTSAHLDAVLAGSMRLRQRPGPRNALGDIKFVFPNRDHIFLHHTPQTALFERDRRDFSHGCIRVEQPLALALFVLEGMPAWTEARVRQAMQAGSSSTVALAQPLPVLITYGTALVRQGRVHFFDDLYGHDRQLAAHLARRRAPLPH
jgi:murein L,D-transpeptidase YcbB/YkuD